jgi:uncharacterized protein
MADPVLTPAASTPAACMDGWDWPALHRVLDEQGAALTPPLLTPEECRDLVALYPQDGLFRSTIQMEQHGFGSGSYRYFADPVPEPVASLRAATYSGLVPLARRWAGALGQDQIFPESLTEFRELCASAGQRKPTPLLLRYGADGWNALHQDLYGGVVFPLQLAILLSEPGVDFDGGEFLLVEARPRQQSRGQAFRLNQGQGILFTTRHRPVAGKRGFYRAGIRHGVSTVTRGERLTLGLILHDAA